MDSPLPVLARGPVSVGEAWDCCSWPSPCFPGCDGGRRVIAHVCETCGRWSRASAESVAHHPLCPVESWTMAVAGARYVDSDGREVCRG